jgi:hypothetical protein
MAGLDSTAEALQILSDLSQSREEPKLAVLCRQLKAQILGRDQYPQQQVQQSYRRQTEQRRMEQMYADDRREGGRQQPPPQQQQQQQLPYITAEQFYAVASEVVKRRAPTYQTSVFKCMGDYEKCKVKNDFNACMIMLIVCVGRQLIPFVK